MKSSFQLSNHYANRSLDPIRVSESCLLHANRRLDLNMFTKITSGILDEQSRESADRHAAHKSLGPLDGVPIAVKDNFCVKGVPTTCASK